MNFFSRIKSALSRESKTNPEWNNLSVYSDVPQAIRMSNNFKTYVKEGYKNSDTLYKCISYLIRNAAAIPPVLYTNQDKEDKIKKHPLLDKLNRPNPEQSGVAYIESVLGYKYLSGNSFQYAIRTKNGPPDELWALRPDRMQILAVPQKGIVGYRHENIGADISPQDIGHIKYWNPDDDNQKGMGMSPVEAAALNIDMQIAGKKWNLALMQNGARPPGIWKVPALMGKNERDSLEQKLNEKFAGATKAGKSPLFDGGLDWKPTGLQPAQMEWLDSLKYNGGSIANILNMPPQLIGDTSSSTYDNMEQAKAASYTEEIFPTLDDLYALWNWWLVPMYPDLKNAYLYYDKESVEVVQKMIQAQKTALAERSNEMWMNGIGTLNECREQCGLPTLGTDGDVFRFGAILVKLDELSKYAEQSLAEPAAPPPALAEPLNVPKPGQGTNDTPPKKDGVDQIEVIDRLGNKHRVNDHKTITSLPYRKASQQANYKIWQCAVGACEFCLDNDGVMVGIDDSFPNGCDVPDDCHRFCRCQAYELSIPDSVNDDSIDNWDIAALAVAFGVGLLASRHDKDVAAQQDQENEEDDEEEKSLLQISRRDKARTMSRQQYRRFMEEVLV